MHSTDNMEDGYIGSGKRLWHSINYHGKENFKIEILEFFTDRKSLAAREKELVNEELLKDPMCMNLKIGGEGGGVLHKMTPEEAKIWHAMGGKRTHELHAEMLSKLTSRLNKERWKNGVYDSIRGNKFWLGKNHSNETKTKMSLTKQQTKSQSEERNSQYGTCWITDGFESKKINKDDLIPNGWKLGRKIKSNTL